MIVKVNNYEIVLEDGTLTLPSLSSVGETSYSTDITLAATDGLLQAMRVDFYDTNDWQAAVVFVDNERYDAKILWTEYSEGELTITLEVTLVPSWARELIKDVIGSDDLYELYSATRTSPLTSAPFDGGAITGSGTMQMSAAMRVADFVERFAAHVGVDADMTNLRTWLPNLVVVPMTYIKSRYACKTTRFFADNLYTGRILCVEDTGAIDATTPGKRTFTCTTAATLYMHFSGEYVGSGTTYSTRILIGVNDSVIYNYNFISATYNTQCTVTLAEGDVLTLWFYTTVQSGDYYGKCDVTETWLEDWQGGTAARQASNFPTASSGYYGGVSCEYGYFGCFDCSLREVLQSVTYLTGVSFVFASGGITATQAKPLVDVGAPSTIENNFEQVAKHNIVKFDNYAEVDDVPTGGYIELISMDGATDDYKTIGESEGTLATDNAGVAKVAMFTAVGAGETCNNEHKFFLATLDASLKPLTVTAREAKGLIYEFTARECDAQLYAHMYGVDFVIYEREIDLTTGEQTIKGLLL